LILELIYIIYYFTNLGGPARQRPGCRRLPVKVFQPFFLIGG
jgi:hypothetical protein